MRQILFSDESLSDRVKNLEEGTNHLFKIVFERLDNLETNSPLLPKQRIKIGIKKD